MDAEPSTSEPAPKPKFTGPMDKYLSDKRVEAAVNRAVKSITDNPADLERELRAFAQTGEDWRQKSMTLEQENEAIRKKLDKVTKELEKVKKAAAFEIGNLLNQSASAHLSMALSIDVTTLIIGDWRVV